MLAAEVSHRPEGLAQGGGRRILNLFPHLDPKFGGISSSLPRFCQATTTDRFRAVMGSWCEPDEDASSASGTGCELHRFALGRTAWLTPAAQRQRLQELIRGANLVHIHGIWQEHCAPAAACARRFGIPTMVSAHGMLDSWAMGQKRLKKQAYLWLIERKTFAEANCLRALTRTEMDDYCRLRLPQRIPIALIPNGIDPPDGVDEGAFRIRFPHLRNQRIVLFLGRLHKKKGLDLLLQAWKSASASNSDAHLVIAGPDSEGLRGELEQATAQLGLSDRVTFAGMLTGADKWSALANATMFVLPSRSEGFSVAVLEALVMGVPVLITQACNFPEVAEYGCGVTIDAEEAQLRRALGTLLTASASELGFMGDRGREMVRSRFTWSAVGRQMTQVYDWLLGAQPPANVEIGYTR